MDIEIIKIKRTINGIEYEFELTPYERCVLWNQMQYANDVEDVESYLEDLIEEDDYGLTEEEIRKLIPGMANRKRRYEDNQWNSDHIYEAIWNVIDDYKDGKVNERGERIAK